MVRRSVPLALAISARGSELQLPLRCTRRLPRSDTSARAAAQAPQVAASSFWTPADPLRDGFDARPLRRRQGQVLAGLLAQASEALEELAVPSAEAPLMLQEFIDPLPGGHTFALLGACAPISRTP